VSVVSLKDGKIKGWNEGDWGKSIAVDFTLEGTSPDDYDALMLPGGVMNPDKLRNQVLAVEFAKSFTEAGKPIVAICLGPQLLIETGWLRGKTLTSFPSLKTDLRNAGANWVDDEVVNQQGLVTSRKPGDIPAFNEEMIDLFASGSENRICVGQYAKAEKSSTTWR